MHKTSNIIFIFDILNIMLLFRKYSFFICKRIWLIWYFTQKLFHFILDALYTISIQHPNVEVTRPIQYHSLLSLDAIRSGDKSSHSQVFLLCPKVREFYVTFRTFLISLTYLLLFRGFFNLFQVEIFSFIIISILNIR